LTPCFHSYNAVCTCYLCQVNEVNGRDNVFVRCVSLFLCVYAQRPVNQTSLKWELNANNSKTVKDTDFKFDTCAPRDSPDITPKIFFKKGAWPWPGSHDPLNFWALHANSSKTVKATDFKFDTRVPRDSPDMTPKNFSKRGRGQGHRVT